jgi:thiol-disulfide isomerase/thioredoxin
MSTKALVAFLLAGTIGLVVYLFVRPGQGDHSIQLGMSHAQACDKTHDDCLPDVKYVDTDGGNYSPQSLGGKVVVVNFWATWCGPCKMEIPALSKIYAKYKAKDVVFLGVLTNDTPNDSQLLNFRSDHEMTYPIVRGNSDILVSYNYPQALPTTLVFNRGGKQVYSHVGPVDEDGFAAVLDKYSAEK